MKPVREIDGSTPTLGLHLTRRGLLGAGVSSPPPAWNEVDQWQAQASSVLTEMLEQSGRSSLQRLEVDLIVDGELTLAGVLSGAMWALSEEEWFDMAQAWAQQQTGHGEWAVTVSAQVDGLHAVVAAMPAAALRGVRSAVERLQGRLRRVVPSWAIELASHELQPDAQVVTALSNLGAPGLELRAFRTKGSWRSLEVLAMADARSPYGSSASSRGAVEPELSAGIHPMLPTRCMPNSLMALDFHAPPAARPTRWAQGITALLGSALVASIAAASIEWSTLSDATAARSRAPAPLAATSPGPRLPVPQDVLLAIRSELEQPWLPMLDGVARSRPADIHLQRVEPTVAQSGGARMRLTVSGQAPSPAAVLAWMRKLEADPDLSETRLSGWQREGEGPAVAFQMEISRAALH